jgi:hypothetical protein
LKTRTGRITRLSVSAFVQPFNVRTVAAIADKTMNIIDLFVLMGADM